MWRQRIFDRTNTTIWFCINANARSSSLTRVNSAASAFITDAMSLIGGRAIYPKSFHRGLIGNFSANFWIDIRKRRSKPSFSCRMAFPESGIGWRTRFCGGQRFILRGPPENCATVSAPRCCARQNSSRNVRSRLWVAITPIRPGTGSSIRDGSETGFARAIAQRYATPRSAGARRPGVRNVSVEKWRLRHDVNNDLMKAGRA